MSDSKPTNVLPFVKPWAPSAVVAETTFQVLGDQKADGIVHAIARDGESTYVGLTIREARAGLVLTPDEARALGLALIERARDVETRDA